jgi:hypothetical protein
MAVMIGKARSNPRVRRLATAGLGASRFKTAETRDLPALRKQLAIARNPARQEQVMSRIRKVVEQEKTIRQSPHNAALLRMAEGIFDFIRETNSLARAPEVSSRKRPL